MTGRAGLVLSWAWGVRAGLLRRVEDGCRTASLGAALVQSPKFSCASGKAQARSRRDLRAGLGWDRSRFGEASGEGQASMREGTCSTVFLQDQPPAYLLQTSSLQPFPPKQRPGGHRHNIRSGKFLVQGQGRYHFPTQTSRLRAFG